MVRARSPAAFLFWARLLVSHDPSLTGAYSATTCTPVNAKAYLRPSSISRAFCEVIHDSTASSFHAFLQDQMAMVCRTPVSSGPPLIPGFRPNFLDHQPCLTSCLKGRSWNTALPTAASDLHQSFHPFYFLLTLPVCTAPRLPVTGLNLSLAADLI